MNKYLQQLTEFSGDEKMCRNSIMYGRTHRNHGGSGEGEISSREERNCEEWRGTLSMRKGICLGPLKSRQRRSTWALCYLYYSLLASTSFFLNWSESPLMECGRPQYSFCWSNPFAFATCPRHCQIIYFFITVAFLFNHSIWSCLVCRIIIQRLNSLLNFDSST